ncbi:MAG: hypothetical protein ACRDD2_08630, partial [Sarcina sp.]
MKKIFKGIVIVGATVAGLAVINSLMLNVNNSLTSKVNKDTTLTLLEKVEVEGGELTFAVESNVLKREGNSWDDGVTLEIDYYEKTFSDFNHIEGDFKTKILKTVEEGKKSELTVDKYLFDKEGKEYLYGIVENPEIEKVFISKDGQDEEAKIIPYYNQKFWFKENTLGESAKIKAIFKG